MGAIERYGDTVQIGDFFGPIVDSPSCNYSLAWGGISAKSSNDHKHYRVISDGRILLAGKVNNRIFTAKIADDGHFALETITPNNTKILLVFKPSGDQLLKKQFEKPLQYFGLSSDGTWITWNCHYNIVIWDICASKPLANFHFNSRIDPADIRYSYGSDIVEVMLSKLGWYRFALDGAFIDEEKWLNDFIKGCDGTTLYYVARDYYNDIKSPTPDDAKKYALWIEEALSRGIEESYMMSISNVHQYLAALWTQAGELVKCDESLAKQEEHLDGFRLVDRAIGQVHEIGDPPDHEIAHRIIADLDRATKTPRLHEYPNYIGKLYRTKGEILERIGDMDGAISSYRIALTATPKAGCKKQLDRLSNTALSSPSQSMSPS